MTTSKTHDELWAIIYKQARVTARHINKINRNAVPTDDIFQTLTLWALEHWNKIEQWDEEDSLLHKLRKTYSNEAQKYATKQRAFKSKVMTSDFFYYTPEILHELLRDVWVYEGWVSSAESSKEYISKTSKPAEGNNRLALLADVKFALLGLNEADRNLLRQRHHDGGMEFEALAAFYGISEEALRKRVMRATNKLQDRLGGEPPIWNRRSRSRSNSQAQAENREGME